MHIFAEKQSQPVHRTFVDRARSGLAVPEPPDRVRLPGHLQRPLGNQAVQRLLRPDPGGRGQTGAVPAVVHEVVAAPGQPLEPAIRALMERRFGYDFARVRVHAGARAAESAEAVNARAYTFGSHVVLGAGQSSSATPAGRQLLAHELTHVVQQGLGLTASEASLEREAAAAERGDGLTVAAARSPRRGLAPRAPLVQCQDDQAAIRARLQDVRARLAALRARHQQLSDRFAGSVVQERERESLARGTERLHAEARSESASRSLWGGSFAARRIGQAVSVSVSGTTATLTANLRIAYLALSDQDARKQATVDIPRIEAAIRDVWQVNIATGDYAGMQFRLVPRISYMTRTAPPPADAFLIQVRGHDADPSSGDSVHGIISLAPAHLEGARVVVVAHELAHLFGFVDAYLTQTRPGPKGTTIVVKAAVGRSDPRNRPDLLGMIDPVILDRWRRAGAVTAQQVAGQTKPVHVWEEDAAVVLQTLGVAPPTPRRPTPESEKFDPKVELDRVRREGEARLSASRTRRERIDNSLESIEVAEQIIRLEQEERELSARLQSSP
jgi:Domain of unknown function (DUF4157)